jgi:LysR family transcriptional regulator, low CO2-responsive transcriptional regulator
MAVTITQLRALVAVAHEGSVQRASERLYVTQPSVSAAVAGLARELGAPLLERDGRGVRLTPAGEAFVPYAQQVLGALDQGRQAAAEAARPQVARVRVIAVNTAGEYLMPALIQAYRALEPATEVLLEIGNRRDVVERLDARRADIGIGGRPLERDLIGRPFLDNDLIVVARETPADLGTATWLLREEGSGTRATLEAYLTEHGIVPREQLTMGSNGAVLQAARIGLGVTLISAHAVAAELELGRLVRVPAPGTPIRRSFHVLLPRTPAPRPAVRRLVAFLHSDAARAAVAAPA